MTVPVRDRLRAAAPVLLPVVVLVVGVAAFAGFSQMRPARPAPTVQERTVVRVQAVALTPQDVTLDVVGHGTARARDTVQLGAEVSGRVAFVASSLRVGSFVAAGEVLVRFAPRPHEIARQVAQADVDRARAELRRLKQSKSHLKREVELRVRRVELARKEWRRLERLKRSGVSAVGPIERARAGFVDASSQALVSERSLDLFPQDVARAEALLASSMAALARADYVLERLVLKAPMAAQVRARQVEVGQVVAPNTPLISLTGHAVYEVPVQLSHADLVKLARIPGAAIPRGVTPPPGLQGTLPATVTWAAQPGTRWSGELTRVESVDTTTRTIPAVVEVRDPWAGLERGGAPLLPGAYCRVRLQGKTRRGAWVVPEQALREGDRLFLVREGKLAIVQVHVEHLLEGQAVVQPASPFQAGDRVVVSRIAFPVSGMRVSE